MSEEFIEKNGTNVFSAPSIQNLQNSPQDFQTCEFGQANEDSKHDDSFSPNGSCEALSHGEESDIGLTSAKQELNLTKQDLESNVEYLITSRPHRKIKPISLFSDLTAEQQMAKPTTSKRKPFKPSHPATLLVQAYGKPCAICLKIIKTPTFLECTRCKQLMHIACISSKSKYCNIQKWLCPKCIYLTEIPQTRSDSKVVVEEIVWALLDGVWLPATAVARDEYHTLSVSVFVNRHSKIDNPFAGKRLVQWFDNRRASYSWIEQQQILDFIEHFQQFAYQNTQFPKRRKVDLEKKIKLALKAIPGFRPKGWCLEQDQAGDCPAQKIPRCEVEPTVDFDQPCPVCDSLEAEDKCLICDNCCMNIHYFCIGLSSVPEGAWICPWCSQGVAFNTEKGHLLLSSFKINKINGRSELTAVSNNIQTCSETNELHESKIKMQSLKRKRSSSNFSKIRAESATGETCLDQISNRLDKMVCDQSIEDAPQKLLQISASLETKIFEFYSKIEREYSFTQEGFYGEQDWLEGSLIGFGRVPLPNGPEIIEADSQITLRCGYGLLHGGTLRTEVFKPAANSSQLKILKYRLRKTSITLQGPMCALHVLQTFSRHVREEVAKNYVMSESILHSIQCSSNPERECRREGISVKSKHLSLVRQVTPDVFSKYMFDCSPSVSTHSDPVPELEFPEIFFSNFEPQVLELAAEAAIQCGNLKFNGFQHVEGIVYEALWIPLF